MSVFEASPEGFRTLNLGRPPAHLIREAIQNVFDEAASFCMVDIKWTPKKGVQVTVQDDVPGGIRDERLIWTIWMSDKQDTPTKRGRMGRGLKELISVSDWAGIFTAGRPAILFERERGGVWSRAHRTTGFESVEGTRVEVEVSEWGKKDMQAILTYLKRIRPPSGIDFTVNGEVIVRKPALESYTLTIPTVTYSEGREINPFSETKVELLPESESWVYEMGLPIESISFPLSIDIGQRVPLREKRDTLIDYQRRILLAKLLDARIHVIPVDQLKDKFVLEAAGAGHFLSDATKKKLADAWTEGRPFASTPQMMGIATGAHISTVNLRSLPEAIRDIVKEHGQDVKGVLEARRSEICPILSDSTEAIGLVRTWEMIAEGIGRPVRVVVRGGQPRAIATYSPGEVALYPRDIKPKQWLAWTRTPLKPEPLSVLIHELAHWTRREESHGFDFHSDAEEVGARVASYLLEQGQKVLKVLEG